MSAPLLPLSRRRFLQAGATGAAALSVPLVARPAAAAPGRDSAVFQHGVASGDPLGSAVVLWTRVTPDAAATPGSGLGRPVQVTWQVAADAAFTQVVRTGTVRTSAERDHTVSVDVTGLTPYTRYHYRFLALGAESPRGRTQTAGDDGAVHALRIGFASCSNYTGGYFTPYRYLAQRDDLDLVLHLGDYLYEYGNTGDRYGPDTLIGVRDHEPATEMVSLADYRQRHAQYKGDPDLQAAHAAFPWVVIFDDHEVANDTYDTGAQNHQPDTEGDFPARRARAYQAYLEWMPIRLPDQAGAAGTRFWRRFSFGPLADLSVVESRQNRTEPVAGAAGALAATDLAALADPSRVLLEPAQMDWLTTGLADTSARWHLVGNQTVFTRVGLGPSVPGGAQLAGLGLGGAAFNADQWDGYQDDQRQVLDAMAAAGSDVVVLTGDIHSSWANEVPLDPGAYVPGSTPLNNSVGVEFVCPSVTSDGFAEIFGDDGAATAATTGLQAENPWVRYLDGIGHGFAVLDVTPERVQSDFFFVSDREDPEATLSFAAGWQSAFGSRTLTEAPGPVGPRSDAPAVLAAPTPAGGPAGAPPAVLPTVVSSAPGGGVLAATGAPSGLAAVATVAVAAAVVSLRSRPTTQGEDPR